MSTDGESNWEQCNDNLRMLRGTAIAFNPDKSAQLVTGTDGAGFYVIDLGISTASAEPLPTIPGTIQAESYDSGGEGVAYHRQITEMPRTSPFQKEAVAVRNGGTGRVVCGLAQGDWLKYSVNVTQPATYDVNFRIASGRGEGGFHLEANGVNVTGPVAATPSRGKTWADVVVHSVRLVPGPQRLKLCVDGAGADLDSGCQWLNVPATQTVMAVG